MGEQNIGQFTDRHSGDSTTVYSQWCLDQGLNDGWMFNDPRTRTTRSPSMSTPVTLVQELPVSKTNEPYPYEVNNLSSQPSSRKEIQRRQKMLVDFMQNIGDPLLNHWPSPHIGSTDHVAL